MGNRKHTSIMSSIRTNCSQLKSQLYNNGLTENKYCTCGVEDTPYHFFFVCNQFTVERNSFFMNTLDLGNINLNTILYGFKDGEVEKNQVLSNAVSLYLESTSRF